MFKTHSPKAIQVALLAVTLPFGLLSCGGGGGTSQAVTNSVAPAITTQPQNTVVMLGETATFSVIASGSAPLVYQWRKGSVAIPGADQATYTIPSAAMTDEGTYEAVVTNGAGQVTSHEATLRVDPASATLAVALSGLPSGVNGSVLVTGPGGFNQSITTTQTLGSLAEGAYTITASQVSSGAVTYGPSPVTQTVNAVRGQSLSVTVVYSPVIPGPVINSFEATQSRFFFYAGTTLTATFSGGSGLIQPGNLPAQNGVPVQIPPHSACIYELVVTGPDGQQAKSRLTVHPSRILAAGEGYTCIVDKDGNFWNWGSNNKGHLLNNSMVDSSVPQFRSMNVGGTQKHLREVAVGIGDIHSLGLLDSGEVVAWGYNFYGELGSRIPIGMNGLDSILLPKPAVSIAAGQSFSIFLLEDGSVWSCGTNTSGQLGDGSTTSKSHPVQVNGLSNVVAISAGTWHSLALKKDGTVWVWGGPSGYPLTQPVLVQGLSQIVDVAAGGEGNVALRADGTLWTWREANTGNFGLQPAQVQDVQGVVAISAANGNVMALQASGVVHAWGENLEGQLGEPLFDYRSYASPILNIEDAILVAVGGATCSNSTACFILRADYSLWASGGNSHGQLGDGAPIVLDVPTQIEGTAPFKNGTLHQDHALALMEDGRLWAWGDGPNRKVLNNVGSYSTSPNQVSGLSTVKGFAAGLLHALALGTDGTVRAWGTNQNGSLGDGSTQPRPTPVQVAGLSGVTCLAAGENSSYALRQDGTVMAWGNNASGQLGDGTQTSRSQAAPIPGLDQIIDIKATTGTVLALRSDGSVFAWGSNFAGQIGDGTTTDRYSPVKIPNLSNVVAISLSDIHALALKADGTVWAWGHNEGILGDGTDANRLEPVQVQDLDGVKGIAAGYRHNLAVKSDGTLWGWGLDLGAVFGTGSTPSRVVRSPIHISNLARVKGVAASVDTSMAWLEDGTLWTWGVDNFGHLGHGRKINRAQFAPVLSLFLAK